MKKASKLLALMLAIIMIASVGLAGCGGGTASEEPKQQDTTQDNAQAPAEQPQEPQELHFMLGDEPPAMDAQLSTDSESFIVLNAVQEGLVRVGPNGIEPGMAESWEISPDGTKYTFHIRKDAKWSNGTPITAQSFIDAWERALNAENAAQYSFIIATYIKGAQEYYDYTEKKVNGEDVEPVSFDTVGVKAIDDHTLEVELVRPTPWFLELTSFATYLPVDKAFIEQAGEKYATEKEYLLYNGPFVIDEWNHEQRLVLKKNPNYWDADTVKLETITLDIVKDQGTALALYEAGDVDRTGLARENVPLYKDDPNYRTVADLVTFYLVFNQEKKPFNNPKVRKAISLALNRQAYVDTILNNGSEPAFGLVPNGFDAYAGSTTTFREASLAKFGKPLFEDNKLDEAKKLWEEGLKEEGFDPATFTFEFLSGDSEGARKSSEFLKAMWKQNLGVDVSIPGVPFKERLKRSREGNFDVVLSGWGPDYNDPLTWLDLFETGGPYNDGKYSNPDYDALIQKTRETTDQEERLGYFLDAEKILMDEMGIAPLYFRNGAVLMRPYVKGLIEKSFGSDFEFKWTYIEGKQQ